MPEEGRPSQKQGRETYIKNFAVQKMLWLSFDKLFREDALKHRNMFDQHLKSPLFLHSGHTTVVMNHIRRSNAMLTENSTAEYAHFMEKAGTTAFMSENHSEVCTVFDLLSEMFTAMPEYKEETGKIRQYLKGHLQTLLGAEFVWDKLPFHLHVFRKTFRQLKRIINSRDETRKPEIFYSSFITAILVAIWKENDAVIEYSIPNYHQIENMWSMMGRMADSAYFRNLSFFFIIGLWLLVKFRREGGYVTDCAFRPLPDQQDIIDEREFQKRVSEDAPPFEFLKFPPEGDSKIDSTKVHIQKQWEVFAIDLLKKGLLTSPEDGYQAVKKSGRPRKVTKRSAEDEILDDEPAIGDPDPPPKRPKQSLKNEKASPRKKQSRKSSARGQQLIVAPPIAPPVSPKAVTPEPIIEPRDVGLEPPIFAQQQAIYARLREEMTKRHTNPELPPFDYQKFIYESYDEVHRIERLTRLAAQKELTAEQKIVHDRIKEKYWKPPSPEKKPEQQPVPEVMESRQVNPPQAKRRGRRRAQ